MRKLPLLSAVLLAGAMGFSLPGDAGAGPLPFVSAPVLSVGIVEWAQIFPRRYYRRYGPYAVPPPVVVVPPSVDGEAYVPPPPPPRPASCGQYRYWNGQACVDARYNTPYLGPKP